MLQLRKLQHIFLLIHQGFIESFADRILFMSYRDAIRQKVFLHNHRRIHLHQVQHRLPLPQKTVTQLLPIKWWLYPLKNVTLRKFKKTSVKV